MNDGQAQVSLERARLNSHRIKANLVDRGPEVHEQETQHNHGEMRMRKCCENLKTASNKLCRKTEYESLASRLQIHDGGGQPSRGPRDRRSNGSNRRIQNASETKEQRSKNSSMRGESMTKPDTSQAASEEKPVDRSNNTKLARGPENFLRDIRSHIQQVSPANMLNGAISAQYHHYLRESSSFDYGSYNGIQQDLYQYNTQIPQLAQPEPQDGRLYMTATIEMVVLGGISLDNASFDIFETSMFDEWRLYAQGFHILTLFDMTCSHFQVCSEKKELLIQLSSVMNFHFSNISSSTEAVLCYFANIDHFMIIYNLLREKYPTRFIDVSGQYLYQNQPPTHFQMIADIPEPSAIGFTGSVTSATNNSTEDLFPGIQVGKKRHPPISSNLNNEWSANHSINQANSIKRAKLSENWFQGESPRNDSHPGSVYNGTFSKESPQLKQLSNPHEPAPGTVSTPPLRQPQTFASPSSMTAAKQLILLSQASDHNPSEPLHLPNIISSQKESQTGKPDSVNFHTAAKQSPSSIKIKAEPANNTKATLDSSPAKPTDPIFNDKKHVPGTVNTTSIDAVSKQSEKPKESVEIPDPATKTSSQHDVLPKRKRGRPRKNQSQNNIPTPHKQQDNAANVFVESSSLSKKQASQFPGSNKNQTHPPSSTNEKMSPEAPSSTKEQSEDPPVSGHPVSARAARALRRSVSGSTTQPSQPSNLPKAFVDGIPNQAKTTKTSEDISSATHLPVRSVAPESEQTASSDQPISNDQTMVEQHSIGESPLTITTSTTKTEHNSVAHSPASPVKDVDIKETQVVVESSTSLSEDVAISETMSTASDLQSDVAFTESSQIPEAEKLPVLAEENQPSSQSFEPLANSIKETTPESPTISDNVDIKSDALDSALAATENVELRDAGEVSKISEKDTLSEKETIAADKREDGQDLKDVNMPDAEEVAEISKEEVSSDKTVGQKKEEVQDSKEDVDMHDVDDVTETSNEQTSLDKITADSTEETQRSENIAADKPDKVQDSDKVASEKIEEIQDSDMVASDKPEEGQDLDKIASDKMEEIQDSGPVSKRLRPPSARRAPIEDSPERQYHKDFMTPFRFEFNDNKRLDITPNDFTRLYEGEYLNDTLVNFYLKFYHQEMAKKNSEVAQSLYVFNTFFYEKLAQKDQLGQFGYSHVKSWTTKVDLFSMKYVIVPINVKMHWFLAIIYNLPALLREKKEPASAEPEIIKTASPSPVSTPVAQPEPSILQAVKAEEAESSNKLVKSEVPDLSKRPVKSELPAPKRELVVYQNGVRVEFPMVTPKADSPEPEVTGRVKTDPAVDRDPKASAAQPHAEHTEPTQKSPETELAPKTQQQPLDDLTESDPPPRMSPPLFTRVTRGSTHSYTLAMPTTPPPSAGSRARKVDIEDDCVVFVLDSFKSRTYTAVNRNMKEYICEEALDKLGVTIEKSRIILKQVDVPQQNNFCDCGVYLIHYVQQFMSDPFRVVDLMAQIVNKGTNNTELKNELLSIWESSQMPRKRSNLQNEMIRWRNEAEKKKKKLLGEDLVDQQAGGGPQESGANTPSRKQLTRPGTPNLASLGDALTGAGSGSGDLSPALKAAAAQGNGPDTSMVLSSDEDEIVVVDVMQKTTARRKPRRWKAQCMKGVSCLYHRRWYWQKLVTVLTLMKEREGEKSNGCHIVSYLLYCFYIILYLFYFENHLFYQMVSP